MRGVNIAVTKANKNKLSQYITYTPSFISKNISIYLDSYLDNTYRPKIFEFFGLDASM